MGFFMMLWVERKTRGARNVYLCPRIYLLPGADGGKENRPRVRAELPRAAAHYLQSPILSCVADNLPADVAEPRKESQFHLVSASSETAQTPVPWKNLAGSNLFWVLNLDL